MLSAIHFAKLRSAAAAYSSRASGVWSSTGYTCWRLLMASKGCAACARHPLAKIELKRTTQSALRGSGAKLLCTAILRLRLYLLGQGASLRVRLALRSDDPGREKERRLEGSSSVSSEGTPMAAIPALREAVVEALDSSAPASAIVDRLKSLGSWTALFRARIDRVVPPEAQLSRRNRFTQWPGGRTMLA
eukprot:scaffold1299_cov246-Pinguiococcus_pyrenoidosus.AAC.19